jgi:peptidoglycan LD-endopeptidase CwlK
VNQTSISRLALIHPYVSYKVKQLDYILTGRSIHIEVAQGLRTWNEQEALYNKGRVTPGPKVTNCQAGHSWHCYALAVDIFPKDLYGTPDWNSEHPVWQTIHEEALTLGFVCGADFRTFPDMPHLQITGALPISPDDAVRQGFMEGGIIQVWAAAKLPEVPQSA